MSEEIGKEIQRKLAKLVHEATGIPVYIVDRDLVDKLSRTLEEVPEIKENFSTYELNREVGNFIGQFQIMEGTLEEKVTTFLEELTTEKNYTAFVLLRGLREYPAGMKLGDIEFVEYSSVPKELVKHISFLKERGYKFHPELDSWIKLNFNSYRTLGLWDICAEKLELPLAILYLISRIRLDLEKTIGIIVDAEKRRGSFLTPFEGSGWSRYNKETYGSYMDSISKILSKDTNTSLEKR